MELKRSKSPSPLKIPQPPQLSDVLYSYPVLENLVKKLNYEDLKSLSKSLSKSTGIDLVTLENVFKAVHKEPIALEEFVSLLGVKGKNKVTRLNSLLKQLNDPDELLDYFITPDESAQPLSEKTKQAIMNVVDNANMLPDEALLYILVEDPQFFVKVLKKLGKSGFYEASERFIDKYASIIYHVLAQSQKYFVELFVNDYPFIDRLFKNASNDDKIFVIGNALRDDAPSYLLDDYPEILKLLKLKGEGTEKFYQQVLLAAVELLSKKYDKTTPKQNELLFNETTSSVKTLMHKLKPFMKNDPKLRERVNEFVKFYGDLVSKGKKRSLSDRDFEMDFDFFGQEEEEEGEGEGEGHSEEY